MWGLCWKGAGWPRSSRHRLPQRGGGGGGRRCSAAHTLAPPLPSSSILPPHPLHLCPYMCPQSGPAFWMVPGSCGPAREKLHGGVLCSQPAHREPLCCLPLGLWAPPPGPPHGEQQASPPVDKCVHPYDAPVVPAAPRARLQPFLSTGVRAGLPLLPTPQQLPTPESHCFSKKPSGSPGERGMGIYFLKFAIHL